MKKILGMVLLFLAIYLPVASAAPKNFAKDPAVVDFAMDMADKHGFNTQDLLAQFAQIRPNDKVLKLIKPPTNPLQRSWERYRSRFINDLRIEGGIRFWQENRTTLAKASAQYGVPEEIIVAIIGVETVYGRNKGNFGVMEALSTLAFCYPPRADFFRTELEQLLLLARENSFDPLSIKGSYAGAIGIPQFMPGSQRRYAVDFDADGKVDLYGNVEDAIGSVARFLEQHGWRAGEPVAIQANTEGEPERNLIEAGIRPTLKIVDLARQGIRANTKSEETVALIDLVSPGAETEYWLGYENFYVITRYNRSSFYAMSVFQLAAAVKAKMAE